MGRKKILCCLAMLIVMGKLKKKQADAVTGYQSSAQAIVDWGKGFDPECTNVDGELTGLDAVIQASAALADTFGRLALPEFAGEEVPESLLQSFTETSDAVFFTTAR